MAAVMDIKKYLSCSQILFRVYQDFIIEDL